MKWKSLTLDDLEGRYCNRNWPNCIGCSTSSLSTAGLSCWYWYGISTETETTCKPCQFSTYMWLYTRL